MMLFTVTACAWAARSVSDAAATASKMIPARKQSVLLPRTNHLYSFIPLRAFVVPLGRMVAPTRKVVVIPYCAF